MGSLAFWCVWIDVLNAWPRAVACLRSNRWGGERSSIRASTWDSRGRNMPSGVDGA